MKRISFPDHDVISLPGLNLNLPCNQDGDGISWLSSVSRPSYTWKRTDGIALFGAVSHRPLTFGFERKFRVRWTTHEIIRCRFRRGKRRFGIAKRERERYGELHLRDDVRESRQRGTRGDRLRGSLAR